MLGLDDKLAQEPGDWPTQGQVALKTGVTRARVGQFLGKDRQRWLKDPAVTRLREQVIGLVDAAGGVLELGELVEGLRGIVPAGEGDDQQRSRQVGAICRRGGRGRAGIERPEAGGPTSQGAAC